MATSDEMKRKAMDAVNHRETRAMVKGRAPQAPVASSPGIANEVKQRAMNAITNVETVTQVGAVKLAGGVAAYVGHIRQTDRDMQRGRQGRLPQRNTKIERLDRDHD